MPEDELITEILSFLPDVAKICFLILIFMYACFSFIVARQTKLMTNIVEVKISPVIYTLSIIHFIFSVFLFVWTIIFV